MTADVKGILSWATATSCSASQKLRRACQLLCEVLRQPQGYLIVPQGFNMAHEYHQYAAEPFALGCSYVLLVHCPSQPGLLPLQCSVHLTAVKSGHGMS